MIQSRAYQAELRTKMKSLPAGSSTLPTLQLRLFGCGTHGAHSTT